MLINRRHPLRLIDIPRCRPRNRPLIRHGPACPGHPIQLRAVPGGPEIPRTSRGRAMTAGGRAMTAGGRAMAAGEGPRQEVRHIQNRRNPITSRRTLRRECPDAGSYPTPPPCLTLAVALPPAVVASDLSHDGDAGDWPAAQFPRPNARPDAQSRPSSPPSEELAQQGRWCRYSCPRSFTMSKHGATLNHTWLATD
jgi:hypothetical protein